MPSVLEHIKVGIKDTANEGINQDPLIPRHKSGYLTRADDNSQQLNADISYTKSERRREIIIYITTGPLEKLDIAPELNMSEAAEIAKKFISDLPHDVTDIDLGPGL